MDILISLIAGLVIGATAYHFLFVRSKAAMKDAFSALSTQTLKETTEQVLRLAETKLSEHVKLGEKNLDGKKQVIDGTLENMRKDLRKVESLMQELEKDRAEKFGKLDERLQTAAQVITDLQGTTASLRNALSRTQGRGQWGERMAEDVLRMAGFLEGINYTRQKSLEKESGRPDFTFLLPQNLKLNMDAKFPFDNYELFVNAKTDAEKEKYKSQFLKDVRQRIKGLQGRAYINPEEHTVDYVLLFIPNEQIYSFINEVDRDIVDEALKAKTILCSPLTLYAILSLIRQAVDNFALEAKSRDMLSLFGKFREQWQLFKGSMEDFGKKFARAQQDYEQEVMGTRLRQLEKPLEKMESLRLEQGLPVAEIATATFEKISVENVKTKNLQKQVIEQ